jgi:hypothetical protein
MLNELLKRYEKALRQKLHKEKKCQFSLVGTQVRRPRTLFFKYQGFQQCKDIIDIWVYRHLLANREQGSSKASKTKCGSG